MQTKRKKKITLEDISRKIDTSIEGLSRKIDSKINSKIEDIAGMTKRGFDSLQENLEKKIDGSQTQNNERFDKIEASQQRIERRLDNKIDTFQWDNHEKRITALEKKAART